MKKNLLQLFVLILATFLPLSSKAVAEDVPLGPLNFEQENELRYWSPSHYVDGWLCKKEEIKYPLISPLKPQNACTSEGGVSDKYTFLDKKNRNLSSVNVLN